MEGILRQAPRLSRPPAAEAGPLQVGWASRGCSASLVSTQAKHVGESGKRGDGVEKLWDLGLGLDPGLFGCGRGCGR